MPWQIHRKKSQSAIVGTIIFIIAAFIIAGVMFSLINYNQNVLTTQKNSIQVQQMASLMEKDIFAYYNYTNNNIYINVSGMVYPYSYYISGISVILKNGSYITFDSYSGGSNSLQIIVKGTNNKITTYNSLPVSLAPNSSALIIISNVKSDPIGISVSVANGKAIASIPVENVQQIISALRGTGVIYIVPPVSKIITNKYFNVSFNIIYVNNFNPGQILYDNYNWSVSFDEQTKINMGYVIFANNYYIHFSNNTNITFIFVPSGYYYYYNISDLYFYHQYQTNKGVTTIVDYICSPNPSSGILLVNQNINVSITYNCNRVS
ncbi:hypothetical protein [Caldisphaera sp.]|uniref:hypothetical protein n=1 Tax=Caldisphaera sp. TaxID=2060322 RepID=UPI003D10EE17